MTEITTRIATNVAHITATAHDGAPPPGSATIHVFLVLVSYVSLQFQLHLVEPVEEASFRLGLMPTVTSSVRELTDVSTHDVRMPSSSNAGSYPDKH